MKLIKQADYGIVLGENSLNHLMLIAIESPDELNDNELDCILNVWKEKPRRIVV